MKAKKETKPISGGAEVDVYTPSDCKRLNFALVRMDGQRYPQEGFAVNRDQVEGVMVVEGEFTITVDDEEMKCKPYDVVYFEEGKSYTVEGKGKVVVAISPADKGKTDIIVNSV